MVFPRRIKIVAWLYFALFLGRPFSLYGQVQGFEEHFDIVNHPEEFLPFWSANEVRNTAARVFQGLGKGKNGSHALGIQPISTFDALVYLRLENLGLENPKLAFFAKTETNGTGTRPALVSLSFAKEGSYEYGHTVQIGNPESFPNKNSHYQLYEVPIPEAFKNDRNFTIRWTISIGPGTGSAARIFLDDVGIWEMEALVDPIRILESSLLNPYWLELVADRDLADISRSQVLLEGKQPVSVVQPREGLVWLESSEMLQDPLIEVELVSINEKNGNTTPEIFTSLISVDIQFGKVLPISPKELLVEFSHPFQAASISQTGKFLIEGKKPSAIDILDNGFAAVLTLQDELLADRQFTIECKEATSLLAGNTNPLLRKSLRFEDCILDIFLSDPRTIQIEFKEPVRLDDAILSKFRFQEYPEFKFNVTQSDEAMIRIELDRDMEEEMEYILEIPPIGTPSGYTWPGLWKSIIWDISPPELTHVLPVQAQKLLLVFSEDLDPAFALNREAYRIGEEIPESIELQAKANQVLTTWNLGFSEGTVYQIGISGIYDQKGNANNSQTFPFEYRKPQSLIFKSLVINEVMPAPRAGNSLPNAEFVEILNISEESIFLGGMQLANSRRQSQIPSYFLEPGEILILCSRTHVPLFSKYGKVLGLSNWPTLLNSGDKIKVVSVEGEILDSLAYTSASFGGASFANGGYSLEISNPFLECNLPSNLKTSQATERGTPGKQNSVFDPSPDLTKLQFLGSLVIGETQVLLQFNKTLQPSLANLSLEIEPKINVQKISFGSSAQELMIDFNEKIADKTLYSIDVKNLRDCTGNLLEQSQKITFAKPSLGQEGDLVINEVLFNPRTGAPKFVEIYNASDKFISLKDWKLANLDGEGRPANRKLLFQGDFLMPPKSFLVFTPDTEKLKQEYPKGHESQFVEISMPSYPIQEGNVVWMNPDESIMELFSYTESMHHRLLKEKKGVSLERSSPWVAASDPNNWKSAASSEGFATPGYRNSTVFEPAAGIGIEVEPKVFTPDGIGEQQYTTISYTLGQAGSNGTITIYSVGGSRIREICQNAIWGNSGLYTWDGTDQSGRRVRPGYYVVWVEIFDLKGLAQQVKKTVVIGTKF